jgi:hypothetical protein
LNNNNNRNNSNNNRRRGRTNRPGGGSGGGGNGQQLNRVDSRARGNAPQLLEKYRKLAQDSHLNGDRVTAEYYLQFADHYFRVLADQRLRQDEQRLRRDDRWEGGNEESEDTGDYAPVSDFPSFDQPSYQRPPRPVMDERPREDQLREDRPRDERPREDRPRQPRRDERVEREEPEFAEAPQGEDGEETPRFEPAENPFVRDNGNTRGLRPRREDRRPRRDERPARNEEPAPAFDASILPPAIAVVSDEAPAEVEAPVKKPRGRPRKVVEAAPAEQD